MFADSQDTDVKIVCNHLRIIEPFLTLVLKIYLLFPKIFKYKQTTIFYLIVILYRQKITFQTLRSEIKLFVKLAKYDVSCHNSYDFLSLFS